MQSSPQNSSLLLTLPREIRDQIYHHLFHNTTFTFDQSDFGITLWYGPSIYAHGFSGPDSKIPQWLRVSKQVFSEAREQFYRRASLTPHAFWDRDVTVQRRQNTSTFLNTTHVTKLFLTGACSYTRNNGILDLLDLSRLGPIVNPSPYHVRLLFDSAPFVKELILQLKLMHSYPRRGTTKLADLAMVTGFELRGKRFEHVGVVLEQPSLHRSSFGDLPLLMEAYEQLQKGVVEVGKRLVKGDRISGEGEEDHQEDRACCMKDWAEQETCGKAGAWVWNAEMRSRRARADSGNIKAPGMKGFSEWQFKADGTADFSRTFCRVHGICPGKESWTCEETGEWLDDEIEEVQE